MRIGLDCRLAGQRHAGIGRYIENLVRRLPELAPEVEWVYFFHDQVQAHQVLAGLQLDQVEIVLAPVRHYSLAEQIVLPGILKQAKLDVLHVPHFNVPLLYRGQTVVTIHDLLWHEQRGTTVTTLPSWQYWLKYVGYRWVATQAIQRAAHVLVPAETIKKTISNYYPAVKNKVTVTKEGVSEEFFKKVRPVSRPLLPMLVYVGSLYPHKNIQLVIESLKHLPQFQLVIVGARNVFQAQVKTFVQAQGLAKRVLFKGYLSDAHLLKLYQQAWALVQPSLSEGFGLTGVEAMAAGVPVAASEIPIFKEIYQNAALYFDPHSVTDFVKVIKSLTPSRRRQLVVQGREVVQAYNWGTMAEQTLAVYRQVLHAHSA